MSNKITLQYGDKTALARKHGVTIQYIIGIEKKEKRITSVRAKKIAEDIDLLKESYKKIQKINSKIKEIKVGDLNDDGIDEGAYAD